MTLGDHCPLCLLVPRVGDQSPLVSSLSSRSLPLLPVVKKTLDFPQHWFIRHIQRPRRGSGHPAPLGALLLPNVLCRPLAVVSVHRVHSTCVREKEKCPLASDPCTPSVAPPGSFLCPNGSILAVPLGVQGPCFISPNSCSMHPATQPVETAHPTVHKALPCIFRICL